MNRENRLNLNKISELQELLENAKTLASEKSEESSKQSALNKKLSQIIIENNKKFTEISENSSQKSERILELQELLDEANKLATESSELERLLELNEDLKETIKEKNIKIECEEALSERLNSEIETLRMQKNEILQNIELEKKLIGSKRQQDLDELSEKVRDYKGQIQQKDKK